MNLDILVNVLIDFSQALFVINSNEQCLNLFILVIFVLLK